MTNGDYFAKLAKMRRDYLGDRYHSALQRLRNHDALPLIPVAREQQAVLEAQIMAELCSGGRWWAHPFGIAKVDVTFSNSAILTLDSHHVSARENNEHKQYPASEYAAGRLLPSAEEGMQVHGPLGLRVARIEDKDLTLRHADSREAQVILRACPGTHWQQHIDERLEDTRKAGFRPLWRERSMTKHELSDQQQFPMVWEEKQGLAWIGSGLLRRIALFHTSSTAHSVSSWITGYEWIVELTTIRGLPLEHDRFLARLTDPTWGLPLRVASHHCFCEMSRRGPFGWQCTYRLQATGDRKGGLQLRFQADGFARKRLHRDALLKAGADRKWLERVLPERLINQAEESDR
ncbi:hypothetical protein [Streptomyces meridianus]|uniref:Uncharacterized protein n=1 Tax=Streptomyces meridianus TaxID=2938945 RepID=A0ABT0X1A1_9ACTN|nr:hypothetical protein [Streptomyces meridianus]MCM2576341.1 hypothetical protein [Streptomyces meridianus]